MQKLEKWGLAKEIFLTQRCQWHRRVDFEFEYLWELKIICESTEGFETVA